MSLTPTGTRQTVSRPEDNYSLTEEVYPTFKTKSAAKGCSKVSFFFLIDVKKKKKSSFSFFFADTSQCVERSYISRPIVSCIPAWIRFAQCIRRYRDSKEAFPHLVNAGKYSTTFFVVIFATLRAYYASMFNLEKHL